MDYGRARVLVIGLDAATFRIIDPLLEQGRLPNLGRLMAEGASGPLRSTIPPLSPAAWVSAMTGRNPGRHGVFDFRHVDPNELHGRKPTFVRSQEYAGSTVFDLLGGAGMRVGAFYIPLTYPAWPVNGVMVSGPITPDHRRAYTYPEALSERLGEIARHISPSHLENFDERAFRDELAWDTERHFEIGLQLLEEEGPFDLFWFHLHSLDSAQHRFWKYLEPGGAGQPESRGDGRADSGLAGTIEQLYGLADRGLGRLLERIGPDSLALVVSDHGARAKGATQVRFNAWLQAEGFLRFSAGEANGGRFRRLYRRLVRRFPGRWRKKVRSRLPQELQERIGRDSGERVDWQATRAYFFPMADPFGGVTINLAGRQPRGSVPPEEYERVRSQVRERLSDLNDPATGRRVVKSLYRKEEVFSGPYTDRAPDLLFEIDEHFHPESRLDGPWIGAGAPAAGKSWSGVHAMEGILVAWGEGILRGAPVEGAQLIDLAPTLLYALGLPIPEDVDGRALQAIFTGEFAASHELKYGAPLGPVREREGRIAQGEEAAMLERLRSLGYIE